MSAAWTLLVNYTFHRTAEQLLRGRGCSGIWLALSPRGVEWKEGTYQHGTPLRFLLIYTFVHIRGCKGVRDANQSSVLPASQLE
jgi:hypothetical protein